jgi:hypothetical protein
MPPQRSHSLSGHSRQVLDQLGGYVTTGLEVMALQLTPPSPLAPNLQLQDFPALIGVSFRASSFLNRKPPR